jgi:putative two-component system response regulator
MEKEKILICDDEETSRHLILDALEGEEYQCFEAASAREVLTLTDRYSPALILLDIRLPDESGLELLPRLKKINSGVLVIAVTAVSELNVAIQCIRRGAYDYITKPINIEELFSCVQRAMETRHLQMQLQDYQHHLEEKVEQQAAEIRQISMGAMSSLSFALESKDGYTAGHSRRVADIGVAIGKRLGLSEDELKNLRWGGLLHDLAKIAVDEKVLHKEGRLTPQEYEHVMTHPVIGACIAGSVVRNSKIVEVIQHHHTHYDGNGLRQTLKREEIPLLARIITVADAYDAMTSNRSYRGALTRQAALDIIKREADHQFDPEIVQVFCQMPETEILPERTKILIADDEEGIRLLVKSVLGNDYMVIEARNGEDAVQLGKQEKPGIILMDLIMPIKDGFQACKELMSNPETDKIPIIIITGFDHTMVPRQASRFDSVGYLTKPFTSQDLLIAMRKALIR